MTGDATGPRGGTTTQYREMVRTNIWIEQAQLRRLKIRAAEENTSVSAIMRDLVARYLGDDSDDCAKRKPGKCMPLPLDFGSSRRHAHEALSRPRILMTGAPRLLGGSTQ